jgi:hypothetical protein
VLAAACAEDQRAHPHTFRSVAVQFFAVGGAQQLNDKNGKKLALKFAAANKFAVVIAKLRSHLPGDDNLVRSQRQLLPQP